MFFIQQILITIKKHSYFNFDNIIIELKQKTIPNIIYIINIL